jgi:predicted negative regulator of RcsB-dependent stress response
MGVGRASSKDEEGVLPRRGTRPFWNKKSRVLHYLGRLADQAMTLEASPILLLIGLFVCSADAAYVVTNTGRQISGSKIVATDDGAVTITMESGQSMTFRKGQYRSAVADRPAGLALAADLFSKGEGDKAVLILKKVKREYRNLQWDQVAIRMLGDHFFATGQFEEAAHEYGLLKEQEAVVQKKIRDAMIQSGDTESILLALNQDIAQGSRDVAAEAYVLRGDLKMKAGDLDGARRDWVKVKLYFKAQKEAVAQAEAKLNGLE